MSKHQHNEDCYEYGCEFFYEDGKEVDDRAELQRVAIREHENMEMLKRVSDMNNPVLLDLVVRGMVAKYYAD